MSVSGIDIPASWLAEPPRSLVVGEGPYARALAGILAAAGLLPDEVMTGPAPNESGGYPRVFGKLQRVFVVAGASQSAADLLRVHDALWHWIEKLSPAGDQHELAILFIIPPSAVDSLARSLAVGLGLERIETGTPGHRWVRMDSPLAGILETAASITPQDLPPLKARQAAEARHAALLDLRQAVTDEARLNAARRLSELFRNEEYLLDLFCRPPCHRNGNRLRGWLNGIVTGHVTPQDQADATEGPADWLDDKLFS
jgi:hypothetical protein